MIFGLGSFAAQVVGVLGSSGLLIRLRALLEALELEERGGLVAAISRISASDEGRSRLFLFGSASRDDIGRLAVAIMDTSRPLSSCASANSLAHSCHIKKKTQN